MAQGRRFIKDVNVNDVDKRRTPSKHYVYIIAVKWSDGDISVIYRRYSKFFDLQVRLLDGFPKEAGKKDPAERLIPFLPGKIIFGRSHIRDVALKRQEPINKYCKTLVLLPDHISRCQRVLDFFTPKPEDLIPRDNNNRELATAYKISEPVLLDQCEVIADYSKEGNNEIDLTAGETVDIIEKSDTGWWFVSGGEGQGWVPSSYLELPENTTDSKQAEIPDRPYLATQGYTPSQSDEITLTTGSVVQVLDRSLDGWWMVSCQGKSGRVPGTYLIPTDTVRARHILAALNNTSTDAVSLDDVSGEPGKSGRLYQRKAPQLPGGQRPQLGDLTSRHHDIQGHSEDSPLVNRKPPPPRRSTIKRMPSPRSDEEEPVYMTIADFQNQAGDGISFNKGQTVEVLDKHDSGWWFVNTDGKQGWVPAAYVNKQIPQAAPKTSAPDTKKTAPASFASELQRRLFNKGGNKGSDGKTEKSTQETTRSRSPLPVPGTSRNIPANSQNMPGTSQNMPQSQGAPVLYTQPIKNKRQDNSSDDDQEDYVNIPSQTRPGNQPPRPQPLKPPPLPNKKPVEGNVNQRAPVKAPRSKAHAAQVKAVVAHSGSVQPKPVVAQSGAVQPKPVVAQSRHVQPKPEVPANRVNVTKPNAINRVVPPKLPKAGISRPTQSQSNPAQSQSNPTQSDNTQAASHVKNLKSMFEGK